MAAPRKSRERGAHQLPPGRHGLPRDYVQTNQRERIIEAVADVVGLTGYQRLSVESIVAAAGVSRRTFYDCFKSKDEAFLGAYDAIGAELVSRVQRAYAASSAFPEGVYACLKEFLDYIAAEPQYAEMIIVEVLGAGADAIERRNAVMSMLATILADGAATISHGVRPPELIAETVIGGIYEIVYSRVLAGEAGDLPGMLGDLAFSVMVPYLGPRAAGREVARLGAAAEAAAVASGEAGAGEGSAPVATKGAGETG